MPTPPIRLLLADVDGTMVTSGKVLTDRAVQAVRKLHDVGVLFAVTSGRPPRGMSMIIDLLALAAALTTKKRYGQTAKTISDCSPLTN